MNIVGGKMFIAIEGLDGSGKYTQASILAEELMRVKGKEKVITLSYPKYGSPCCIAVEKFLRGDFGLNAEEIDPYTVSTFYAIDRYADYKENWGKKYDSSMYIVADRYVQSNMIYQLAKLHKEDWDDYIKWLEDLEYNHNGLPKPDLTIFLDVPIEVSQKLMTERYKGVENAKDINEKNLDYLMKCKHVVDYLATNFSWKTISCIKNGVMLPKEEIAKLIKIYVRNQEKVKNFTIEGY